MQPDDIGRVYQKFALGFHEFYTRFAQQAISDVVQHFHPSQFWLQRETIVKEMEARINRDIR